MNGFLSKAGDLAKKFLTEPIPGTAMWSNIQSAKQGQQRVEQGQQQVDIQKEQEQRAQQLHDVSLAQHLIQEWGAIPMDTKTGLVKEDQDLPDLMIGGVQAPKSITTMRKANPSQVVKWKDHTGQDVAFELPGPEQQAWRQMMKARAEAKGQEEEAIAGGRAAGEAPFVRSRAAAQTQGTAEGQLAARPAQLEATGMSPGVPGGPDKVLPEEAPALQEAYKLRHALGLQKLQTVKDEAGYNVFKALHPEMEPPDQYDPAWIASTIRSTIAPQDQPKYDADQAQAAAIKSTTPEDWLASADAVADPKFYPQLNSATRSQIKMALRSGEADKVLTILQSAANRIGQVEAAKAGANPEKERIVQIEGPGGKAIWVRESQAVGKAAAQPARAPTGADRQALAYFNRAKQAVDTISNPTKEGKSLEEIAAESGLLEQGQLKYAPNWMKSSNQQAYTQAQRSFTEARLRKESGAAIPQHEFDNDARMYFVQPGDSKEVIEQKRQARETVLDGMAVSSGKGYEEYYGEPYVKKGVSGNAAGSVPAAVKSLLKKQKPGIHKLSDGSTWMKAADGTITGQ